LGSRILIVDDSASMRALQHHVLRGAGYEVIEAGDGEEALRMLDAMKVSLIITDLNMPGLDGVELIRAVRGSATHKRTPILMVTTHSGDEKKREGRTAGATAWMVKPFEPEQLLAIMKRLLG
jgi:two-component system chemotaxis response regulator CheY